MGGWQGLLNDGGKRFLVRYAIRGAASRRVLFGGDLNGARGRGAHEHVRVPLDVRFLFDARLPPGFLPTIRQCLGPSAIVARGEPPLLSIAARCPDRDDDAPKGGAQSHRILDDMSVFVRFAAASTIPAS